MNLEHSVVRRNRFERDVGVPASAGESANVAELMGEATALFLLLATYNADLVPKFAGFFGQRMYMQTGGLGLMRFRSGTNRSTISAKIVLTQPAASVRRRQNCFICSGVTT